MAQLHPTGHHHHPERPERLAILLDALGGATRHGRRRAARSIEPVHDPAYVDAIASLDQETWLDGDTFAGPTSWEAARLAPAARSRRPRSEGSRSCDRPVTMP